MFILLHLLLFLLIRNVRCENNHVCLNKSDGFYPSNNCHLFYSCRNETLYETSQCSNPLEPIFSPYRQRCVTKNLLYDECELTNLTENLSNCAWFSIQLATKPNLTFHYSCLYSFLFDRPSKECKHYSQVQCHRRFEPKDACDYHHPQIFNSINERPCWLIPSCRNKTNGFYGNQLQECSTYYQCKDERFISSTICPRRTRFSKKYHRCLPTLINCEETTVN